MCVMWINENKNGWKKKRANERDRQAEKIGDKEKKDPLVSVIPRFVVDNENSNKHESKRKLPLLV